jgi:iron complex outermembrane receptor protein
MKQFFTLTILSFFFYCASAQNATITGVVRDSTSKEFLSGVAIRFDKVKGAISNASGNYNLSLPAGEYRLTFSLIGYKKVVREISLKEDEKLSLDIVMRTDAMMLNEIVSVSQYKKNAAKESVSTDVIGKNQIKNTNANDLGEIVNKSPGVLVQDGQISIRGGSSYSYGVGGRTAVNVDGLGMTSSDLGESQNKMIPVGNVKQVEVIKGASSVVYGSSALNGVVNVITEWPTQTEPKTEIDVNVGVSDKPKATYLKWWDAAPPCFTNINVNHQQKIKNLQLVAGGNITLLKSHLQFADEFRGQVFFKTRYLFPKISGLALGINGSTMYEASDRFFISKDMDSALFYRAVGSNDNYVKTSIDPHLAYSTVNGHGYKLNIRYLNIFRKGNGADPNAVSHSVQIENQYQYKLKNNLLVVTAGLPLGFATASSNLYKGNRFNFNAGAYVQAEVNYKILSVQAGVRYEVIGVDTLIVKSKPVFRAGINVQAAKATFIRASWGQAYRIPSIGERFIAQTFFNGILVVPNDTLRPETGWSFEIGLKQGFKIKNWQAYVDVSFFWQEYKNFIEYNVGIFPNLYSDGKTKIFPDSLKLGYRPYVSPSDTGYNPGDSEPSLIGIKALNVENARIAGYEASIMGKGNIGPVGVQILAGYTYNFPSKSGVVDSTGRFKLDQFFKDLFTYNTKRVDSKNQDLILSNRVRHLVRADLELSYKGAYIGATVSYASYPEVFSPLFNIAANRIDGNKKTFDTYNSRHQKGDIAADMRVGYKLNDHVSFGFIVKNLANRVYTLRPGRPEALRNFTLQFKYVF